MLRKIVITSTMLLSIALVTIGVLRLRSVAIIRAQQNTVVPYTLYMATELTDASGRLTSLHAMTAKRSDGGSVQKNFSDTKDGVEAGVTVVDPVAKVTVFYETSVKLKYTMPLTTGQLTSMRVASGSATCADVLPHGPTFIAWDQVAGVRTAVYRREDAHAVWTYDLAPELNCALLKQGQDWKAADGTRAGTTRTQVVMVARGEPDRSLFAIPEDLIEVYPSTLDVALWDYAHAQTAMPAPLKVHGSKLDTWYMKLRQSPDVAGVTVPAPVR